MKLAKSVTEGFVLLLTGTPITNRPDELIPQLEAIDKLHNFGGGWRFKQRYAPQKNVAINTKELNDKLRSFCFIRRLKRDVYGELPPLRNAVQLLSIVDKDRAQYDEIEANVVEYLAQRAREIAEEEGSDGTAAYWSKRMKAEAAEHLVRISVLRDSVSKIKYDAITKWLDNFLESGDGEKVIVFAEHIDFVEKLAKRYGNLAVKIRGGVSVKDRQDAVDRFQTDPTCRIFIGNMAAASEGLTLTAASDVVFCELAWTPAMHEQCASRAWGRINDMHGCTAWYLLAPKTIDEDMYELLEKKKKIVDAVTDGIDIQDDGDSILAGLLVKLAERGINV
jgi:SWI/SNF-related matrix-associated actin-dependent regulator 1 of chromatin subfamily A